MQGGNDRPASLTAYNGLIGVDQMRYLELMSRELSDQQGRRVSKAEIVRDALKLYMQTYPLAGVRLPG